MEYPEMTPAAERTFAAIKAVHEAIETLEATGWRPAPQRWGRRGSLRNVEIPELYGALEDCALGWPEQRIYDLGRDVDLDEYDRRRSDEALEATAAYRYLDRPGATFVGVWCPDWLGWWSDPSETHRFLRSLSSEQVYGFAVYDTDPIDVIVPLTWDPETHRFVALMPVACPFGDTEWRIVRAR